MAQIREFTVEGLAGRSDPISFVLNSDVNVFFGLNGSGKTTLLKILHSALSTEVDVLKDLPFARAAVKVYLNRYGREFVRTFTRRPHSPSEEVELSVPALQRPLWNLSDLADQVSVPALPPNLMFDYAQGMVVEAPKWSSDPPEPDGRMTAHSFGFLPISRLYRNLRTPSGSSRLSDQELDSAFARGLQAQWSEYYADISNKTAKAQERGLANILGFFLAGGQDQSEIGASGKGNDHTRRPDRNTTK